MELSFALHKLEIFSANPGKSHFKGLVHIRMYIRNNKTLGLNNYANINDSPVSDLLRQASIKNEKHLMAFSDSSWQDYPDTVRRTGAYIIFHQVGKLTMVHMLQDQLLNQVHKVSTIQHSLQEWL